MEEIFTPGGVRRRLAARKGGDVDWVLVPGGPGLGSESLVPLADAMAKAEGVSGTIWLADLPGDGSNRGPFAGIDDPFARWPGVIEEAVTGEGLGRRVILVAHSTGGMYALSTPGLEKHLAGIALLSSAPDAGWRKRFADAVADAEADADADADADAEADADADADADAKLGRQTLDALAWSFTPDGLARDLSWFSALPFNARANAWSDRHFDDRYAAVWIPTCPTLILGGAEDRIIPLDLFEARRDFQRQNISFARVAGAGHFPWIEQPVAVAEHLAELERRSVALASWRA